VGGSELSDSGWKPEVSRRVPCADSVSDAPGHTRLSEAYPLQGVGSVTEEGRVELKIIVAGEDAKRRRRLDSRKERNQGKKRKLF